MAGLQIPLSHMDAVRPGLSSNLGTVVDDAESTLLPAQRHKPLRFRQKCLGVQMLFPQLNNVGSAGDSGGHLTEE